MSRSDPVDPVSSSDTGSTASGSPGTGSPGTGSPGTGDAAAKPTRKKRWGLRTLGCLAIVITSIVVADAQGHHTPGTLGCIVLGTGAALYCTVRGLQDLFGLEWYKRRLDARSEDEL